MSSPNAKQMTEGPGSEVGLKTAEERESIAWSAWNGCQTEYGILHRVYCVALHERGEAFFQLGADNSVQFVRNGGYGYTEASASQLSLLGRAMRRGWFMVCVRRRSSGDPIYRVWPGKDPDWSMKDLRPRLGGFGRPGIVMRQ